jgi:endo-1,4-beta-xylanase
LSHLHLHLTLYLQTALQCVQNKDAWPTVTTDGSKTPLVEDLSFVHAAFKAAYQAAGKNVRLSYNDYSTGGNDAKTACVLALIDDIVAWAGVPADRLAVGFQSHVTAQPYYFVNKNDLSATFDKLAASGVHAFVTELDIKVNSNSTADQRYQAAIWGDYLDVRPFSPASQQVDVDAPRRRVCMPPTAMSS